jgi:hypothetical protein
MLTVDENFYSITPWELGVHTVMALITEASGSVSWCITTIYGPQDELAKQHFLGEIRWIHIVCLLCLTNGS